MKVEYWVLGRRFEDDHERAIRFSEIPSVVRRKVLGMTSDILMAPIWCDPCKAYHYIRPDTGAK